MVWLDTFPWRDEGKARAAEVRDGKRRERVWEGANVRGWRDITALLLSHLQILSLSVYITTLSPCQNKGLSAELFSCTAPERMLCESVRQICFNVGAISMYITMSLANLRIHRQRSVRNEAVCVYNVFAGPRSETFYLCFTIIRLNIKWTCSAAVI